MTAPYASKVKTYLPHSLRHIATVTAHPLTGAPFALDPAGTDLSVTFDESWSPYAQGTLSATVPASSAQLDKLDPRTLCRITIDAGYTYPDATTEVFPLADLGLKSRDVNRPGNVVALTAESDESLAQDYVWRFVNNLPTSGINEAVSHCLGNVFPNGYTLSSWFPNGSYAGALSDLVIDFGSDLWSVLDEIASRTGQRIYCDEDRVWRIRPRPELTGSPKHFLTVGQDGTITDTASSLTRDDWYNNVSVLHEWTPEGDFPTRVFAYAEVSTGPMAVWAVGYKAHTITSNKPISVATAKNVAESKLRNLISRGRSIRLTAIAAYWLRPGDTISVTLPTGEPELHLIQAITFRPLLGLMEITTRQPSDAVITATGV